MTDTQSGQSKPPIRDQVSAGGVVWRAGPNGPEVAIVRVPPGDRWQLPKGLVGAGETPEETALREVREEAGVQAKLLAPIEVIEYWYVGPDRRPKEGRVRFHKFVHFFLMTYRSGDVADHDREVEEARWVDIEQAMRLLAFKAEQGVVAKAKAMIGRENDEGRRTEDE